MILSDPVRAAIEALGTNRPTGSRITSQPAFATALKVAPFEATPPDTAAEAPPPPSRDATDQIVDRLLVEAGDETDEMAARLRAIVDGATDMGELSERLLAALPGISPEALAQAVGDALVVAHLAGLEGDGA